MFATKDCCMSIEYFSETKTMKSCKHLPLMVNSNTSKYLHLTVNSNISN